MKDIEWLKDEVKSLFDGAYHLGKMEYYESEESIDRINSIIDQLDEPEKPVIPQFIADWIEECKEEGMSLFGALDNYGTEELHAWKFANSIKMANAEIFARAWLDGYEVEKEKKYRVVFRSHKDDLILFQTGEHIFIDAESANGGNWKQHFTESEIKAIDIRYWAFAEEVVEND